MAVECRVCGRSVGREPEDYQEVVDVLRKQPTLHQAALDERQLALPEAIQS